MKELSTGAMAVIERHAVAFGTKDVDAILSDYYESAVLFTTIADKPLVGHSEIRRFLEDLFTSSPSLGERPVNPIRKDATGEYAYVLFENNEIRGTETYVIRDGKIVCESSTMTKK
ncbi:YybH family protein [Sphingobium lactosutens]|uniref:YybH family protein n=1 Tax=Sphingobium lactosutens TaxID=522773 RepID=UPI0015BABB3E|nr:nuclear transport factor 2 family protein [Sphingobium lactosutens]